jgi:probable HAF family extracellular repeat protein
MMARASWGAGHIVAAAVAGLGLAVAGCLLPSPARVGAQPARPEVTTTVLPGLEGAPEETNQVADINDRGQIVGASNDRPVLWEEGRPQPLADARMAGRATAVNDAGQVLYEVETVDGVYTGNQVYLWDHGRSVGLNGGVSHAQGFVLNERGQVLMVRHAEPGLTTGVWGVWEDGTFTEISVPEGWALSDPGLSDGGHVVGTFSDTTRGWCPGPAPSIGGWCVWGAFMWREGELTTLGERIRPIDVNRHGDVAIIGTVDGVWHDGDITPLGMQPQQINDRGQVVGTWTWWLWQGAAVWDGNRLIQLGNLGGTVTAGMRVRLDDRGQVIGVSTTAQGERHAFLWDDGELIDLGPARLALDLNDHGQVIGDIERQDPWRVVPLLWEVNPQSDG